MSRHGRGLVKGHSLISGWTDPGKWAGHCLCGEAEYTGPTLPKVERQHGEHLWEVRHAAGPPGADSGGPAATSEGTRCRDQLDP